MGEVEEYQFGSDQIITCFIPSYRTWIAPLLIKLEESRSHFEHSHRIGDRWENTYLNVSHVPSVALPMRLARDLAKEKWGFSTMVLYESMPNFLTTHPPFWFNIAKTGERTGVHDHAKLASVSGVAYLKCCSISGDLFFRKEGEKDFSVVPEEGKMVLFPSNICHGVRANESSDERISLAFNLYPFPIPSDEW